MNTWWISAGAVLALTCGLHVVGGGRDVFAPLMAAAPNSEMQLYQFLLWHFITAWLAISALAVIWAALRPALAPAAHLAGWLSLAAAILFMTAGLRYVGTLWVAPQWTIFLVVSALIFGPVLLSRTRRA